MNWTQILESLGSVAVVVLPPLIAHYRKLSTVLETVTKVLDSVESVRVAQVPPPPPPVQSFAAPVQQTLPGSGMVNENSD
jgi:hypothetical protein